MKRFPLIFTLLAACSPDRAVQLPPMECPPTPDPVILLVPVACPEPEPVPEPEGTTIHLIGPQDESAPLSCDWLEILRSTFDSDTGMFHDQRIVADPPEGERFQVDDAVPVEFLPLPGAEFSLVVKCHNPGTQYPYAVWDSEIL